MVQFGFGAIEGLANNIETVANLLLILAALKWLRGFQWVTIHISIGTFKVQRKDMDLPTLTAIVSENFFDGGWLPDSVRKELLTLTTPVIGEVKKLEDPNP